MLAKEHRISGERVAGGYSHRSVVGKLAGHIWASMEIRIFLISLAIHLAFQVVLNTILPLPYFFELGMGDAQAYYPISVEPFPPEPLFSPNKYRRILLPFLVHTFFPWQRHFGFLLLGIVAVSLASVFFYRIARRYTDRSLEVTLLFSALPYLFAGAHLGYTEPLMVLGLLAGYDALLRTKMWQAVFWHSWALLSKELALVSIAVLVLLLIAKSQVRQACQLALAIVPALIYYLGVGIYWGNPFWILTGDVERQNLSFALSEILDLLFHASAGDYPAFILANQALNILFFILLLIGIWKLRKHKFLFWYLALSSIPLFFLGEAIVDQNWHVGRQGLIASLALLGFGPIMPRSRWFLVGLLILMFLLSFFHALLWARFFWVYKFW